MAAAIPYIVMAVGTAISAQAQRQQAKAQEESADFEAAQMEKAANARRASAQRQALEEKRQGELKQSRALALAASSGASASDTGFTNLLADIAGESRYRQMVALYGGETAGQSLQEQAAFTRYSGRQIRKAGNLAAAATVLKGASSMYGKYGGGGPSGNSISRSNVTSGRVGYGGNYGPNYGFA